MGGFAAGFAGGLGGAGQEIQQRNLFNLAQDIQQKEHLAKAFEELAQNPNVRPEVQQQMLERSFQIRSLKPGANHKKLADISDLASAHYAPQIPPPPGQAEAQQVPQGPQAAQAMSSAGILAPQDIQQGAADVGSVPSSGPSQGVFLSPQEHLAMGLRAQAMQALQQHGMQMEFEKAGIQQRRHMIESDPELSQMTPRQKASLIYGQNVTSELRPQNIPGVIPGGQITDQTDAFGNQIDPTQNYRAQRTAGGDTAYYPTMVPSLQHQTGKEWVKTPDSSTGWAHIYRDTQGNQKQIVKDVMPPPGYLQSATTTESVRIVPDADGNLVAVPVTTTSSTGRVLPGGVPSPAPIPAPPGAGTSPPIAPVPRGAGAGAPGRIVGKAPGQLKREQEMTELSPQGQKMMEELQPVKNQFQELIQKLEPFKTNNTPGYFSGRRLLYKVGVAPDESKITGDIANLSLASIQGMMPFAKASRNYQYIKSIGDHLPNVWVDSPKNVYQKLVTASKNFDRMENSINRFETKHAKGTNVPTATAPPTGGSAEDEADQFLRAKGLK